MRLFRKALNKAKPAPTPPRPTDPKGGLASVARAALNARGNAKKQQAIRLAKRLGRQ
jgi:hypothetical protein